VTCTPCNTANNEYVTKDLFTSICKKCYGEVKTFDDGGVYCDKCAAGKYFMKASQKCETCEGSPEIEIENDPNTADDNEYKCSPCTDLGANYYFDTTEKKCKECVLGTIAADGKTCAPCEGTVSLDFKTCNPCTDLGADYYFDTTEKKCKACVNGTIAANGKTCTPCEGTVSLDFKTCNPCDKAGKNELWDKDTKTCQQCLGTINSTTCQDCNTYDFFN
jgi:hypothetical protein